MSEAASLGGTTPNRPPSIAALKNYDVNRAGQFEVIWQPLYDYTAYDTLGHTQLTFFQTTVGGAAAGLSSTNMRAQGQLPKPQEFLVTGIQVTFEVGAAIAQAAAATATNWQDVFDVMNSGNLQFLIGSKSYLNDAPLGVFPQQFGIGGEGATGATTAMDYARSVGKYYSITPIKLPANQNFEVSLNWPEGAVTVTTDGVIGVRLEGFLYRLSQ